jgi:hypothetical protein
VKFLVVVPSISLALDLKGMHSFATASFHTKKQLASVTPLLVIASSQPSVTL